MEHGRCYLARHRITFRSSVDGELRRGTIMGANAGGDALVDVALDGSRLDTVGVADLTGPTKAITRCVRLQMLLALRRQRTCPCPSQQGSISHHRPWLHCCDLLARARQTHVGHGGALPRRSKGFSSDAAPPVQRSGMGEGGRIDNVFPRRFFFIVLRSHSVSLTRAHCVPTCKPGFGKGSVRGLGT